MCLVMLAVAVLLLVVYLDSHLMNWHLVEKLDAHSQITLAIGWEMIPAFWPLILLTVLATLLVVLVYQRLVNKRSLGCSTCPTDSD